MSINKSLMESNMIFCAFDHRLRFLSWEYCYVWLHIFCTSDGLEANLVEYAHFLICLLIYFAERDFFSNIMCTTCTRCRTVLNGTRFCSCLLVRKEHIHCTYWLHCPHSTRYVQCTYSIPPVSLFKSHTHGAIRRPNINVQSSLVHTSVLCTLFKWMHTFLIRT